MGCVGVKDKDVPESVKLGVNKDFPQSVQLEGETLADNHKGKPYSSAFDKDVP